MFGTTLHAIDPSEIKSEHRQIVPFSTKLRGIIKALARGLATIVILPELISFWLRTWMMGRDRALEGSTQTLAFLPGMIGQYLRRAFLARTIAFCHPSATISYGTLFSKAGARIDQNVYIGPRCHIGLVHIGAGVLLAAGVHVTSGAKSHGYADSTVPIREQPGTLAVVRIGAGSWIGSAAVVMADVGRDTIVGAGAVVVQTLPDQVVAVGVPARIVRNRDGVDVDHAESVPASV